MKILAIDGALNCTGWVFLEDRGGTGTEGIRASQYGTIATKPTMSLGFKLAYIRTEFLKLIKKLHPQVIVLEDTYSGKNALTNARLNNAKGVFMLTAYEMLGTDPMCITAAVARKCLGFKNNKEDPYEFFQNMYKLKESFQKGNDITDAFTLGWYYILTSRDECVKKTKKKSAKIKEKKTKAEKKMSDASATLKAKTQKRKKKKNDN